MTTERIPAVVAFGLWVCVAATATGWGLSVWPHGSDLPNTVPVVSASGSLTTPSPHNMAKLLDQQAMPFDSNEAVANQPMASRLALAGIAKAGHASFAALIAVDGQPAKSFLQGQEVLSGWVLHAVTTDQALLSEALTQTPTLTLSLPKRDITSENSP